jgi:hypothetical protein
LPDDGLLCQVQGSSIEYDDNANILAGEAPFWTYVSTDQGQSWQGPNKICDWAGEGGMAQTASGKLLAVVRYQRPLLPSDPPGLMEKTTRHYKAVFGKLPNRAYKHVFLVDSEDGGRSWQNFRQLTTVFGPCYGFPAAQSDGTVVVVHDHRYPRDLSAGRAMVSRDEGQTWEDEAYYLYYGAGGAGYSQSLVLEDDLIVTVAGTCDDLEARKQWDAAIGKSHTWAIRWKPVKD